MTLMTMAFTDHITRLANQLFCKEMVICQHAQDTECELYDHFHKGSHWVFALPKLQHLLMPQQMISIQG